jgi:hypothetical protein
MDTILMNSLLSRLVEKSIYDFMNSLFFGFCSNAHSEAADRSSIRRRAKTSVKTITEVDFGLVVE